LITIVGKVGSHVPEIQLNCVAWLLSSHQKKTNTATDIPVVERQLTTMSLALEHKPFPKETSAEAEIGRLYWAEGT
jgi:hypothetical protein